MRTLYDKRLTPFSKENMIFVFFVFNITYHITSKTKIVYCGQYLNQTTRVSIIINWRMKCI